MKTDPNDIRVRRALLTDIDAIYAIENVAYGKNHWSIKTFHQEFSNPVSNYFVVELIQRNKVIGYCGYWKILDEGHITTMAIDIDYRKNGLADKLLYNIITSSKIDSINWLTLEVKTSNIPAINLYKKNNFKIAGIRKKYYQDTNEDAYIMWLEL